MDFGQFRILLAVLSVLSQTPIDSFDLHLNSPPSICSCETSDSNISILISSQVIAVDITLCNRPHSRMLENDMGVGTSTIITALTTALSLGGTNVWQ